MNVTLYGRTRGLKVATTAARLATVAGGRFGTLRVLEVAVDRVRAEYRLGPSAPWQPLGRLRVEVNGNTHPTQVKLRWELVA